MFHAFGDESEFASTVVYAAVAIPNELQEPTIQALRRLKESFGVGSGDELHASHLFHREKRLRSGWAHLGESQVLEFCERYVQLLCLHGCLFSVCAVHGREPVVIPGDSEFPGGVIGTKQHNVMLFKAAFAFLAKEVGPENLQFWADQERTKIDWFGKRTRVESLHTVFPIDDPDSGPLRTETAEGNCTVLLEAADLLAYICSHGLAPETCRNKEWFEKLYSQLSPWLSVASYDLGIPESRDGVPNLVLRNRHDELLRQHPPSPRVYVPPIGGCVWTKVVHHDGSSASSLMVRVLPGTTAKVNGAQLGIEIRSITRQINGITIPVLMIQLSVDPTIFATLMHPKANPVNSVLSDLADGRDFYVTLTENPGIPPADYPITNGNPGHWTSFKLAAESSAPYTEEEFFQAAAKLESPQRLWEAVVAP